jgi:indolepyruvate ferredoxin oxidoreductase beta subunit
MNASNMLSANKEKIDFLLVGVGGQGTILASNILAELGMKLGFDVKKAEVHGMSQRGGSVISHVRWGAKVFSPIIEKGGGDVMIAFEKMEANRYIDILKPGGIVLVNDHSIMPITVSSGYSEYPQENLLRSNLVGVTANIHWVDGLSIAEEVGNTKTANVVLLGALSGLLDMPLEPWLEVIEAHVPPKFIEMNRQAFITGRQKTDVVV